jgi:class 3 adenylate cyclase
LSGPRPIVAQLEVQFAARPDELWPLVADTNRFNHAVGLPAVDFVNTPSDDGETRIGEMRAFGIAYARWIEHPFEWQRPRAFAVSRDFLSGPLRHLRAGAELTPVDDHTSVRFYAELTPRSAVFAPVIQHIVAPRQIARARRQFDDLRAYLEHRSTSAFPSLKHRPTDLERRRVQELTVQLTAEGTPPEILDALRDYLLEAGDEDVSGMRPLELAERWRTEPRATLETFLRGATVGLLEMRWELLCPSCRGVNVASVSLHDLQGQGQCTACNVQFTASLDEAIEARFYPAPAVRSVNVGTYCVGGPMNTPHRDVQLVLGPGEVRHLSLVVPEHGWIMRSPQSAGVAYVQPDASAVGQTATIKLSANLIMPDEVKVAPGPLNLSLSNERSVAATVSLDDTRWSEQAATPGRLLTYPAFHSLFSAEALAPGVELAVSRVGLLFTDLAGSTAMYERAGDAAAFRMVSEHFRVLEQAIETNDGALIKTIGDAVMAAFPDGRQALRAALDIQREIEAFDTRGLADPHALIKIGVHAGACFVVTLNERLDYFGTAVNIAARAQGEAHGGDVVVTLQVSDEAAELLEDPGLTSERFAVLLRGISEPVELVRISRPRR